MTTRFKPANCRLLLLAIMIAYGLGPVASFALADDARERAEGAAIAQELCSGCHIVDDRQSATVPDGVPPFPLIAIRPGRSEGFLEAYLSQPQPPMPHVPLSARQVKSVIAYIQSFED